MKDLRNGERLIVDGIVNTGENGEAKTKKPPRDIKRSGSLQIYIKDAPIMTLETPSEGER